MSVLIFIIILALLILVHEFGHFIVAKKSGIRVDEFAIGFPPTLFKWTKGETTYAINLIPFGGYVKIYGENPEDVSENDADSKRSLTSKSKWIQAAVLFAGVFFNFLLGWFLISLAFTQGMPVSSSVVPEENLTSPAELTITGLFPNSVAEESGLKVGDKIKKIESNSLVLENPSVDDLSQMILTSNGSEILINYQRGEILDEVLVSPEKDGDKFMLGITMDELGIVKLPIHKAIISGLDYTIKLTATISVLLFDLVKDAFAGEAVTDALVGPVGIVGMVGDANELGFVYLLLFTALISIHLAIINLVPFPALDGGRLLFLVIEAIKGSPIKPKIANTLNLVGFSLLILLMIFITYKDILRLFS